jgi:thiol-disulfide isomerase/thioredoxin
MVNNRFSVILTKVFISSCLMAISLSVSPADSNFFQSTKDLQPVVPVAAPPVNLPVLNTKDSKNNENGNEVKLVHFWASWCVPCREEFPALQRLHEDYNEKGLSILAVAADNKKAITEYMDQQKIALPVVIDQYGEAMFDYRVKALPSSYLVDREGKIRFMATGHVRWDGMKSRVILEQLINE